MNIEIINQTKQRTSTKSIIDVLNYAEDTLLQKKILKIKNSMSLIVIFVSENKIKKLNFEFRNKNKSTDILSFSPVEPNFYGELVLSYKMIKKQSVEHQHSIKMELSYMLIHGFLHLLGYDHEKSEVEANKMFRLQDQIWKKYWKL